MIWFKNLKKKKAEKKRTKQEVDAILNEAESFIKPYMALHNCTPDEATRAWVREVHKRCKKQMKIEQLFIKLGI